MENASKALIIAGTVLIVLILASISIHVIQTTEGAREQANRNVDSLEVQSFNERFTAYQGTMINASQIKSLLLLIKSNNSHYGHDDTTPIGTDKYIHVQGINSLSNLYPNKTYKVEVTGYNTNGYIQEIKIDVNL